MRDSGNNHAKRILVVEDDPMTQKVTLLQLRHLGFEPNLANNGREAVAAATTKPYDLILMDCMMPEMDGFEATARIRRHEAVTGVHVPIVAFTASNVDDAHEKCIAAGMDDILPKRGNLQELRAVIEQWIGLVLTP